MVKLKQTSPNKCKINPPKDSVQFSSVALKVIARLDEALTGIKTANRKISNLRHADDTTLMAEGEEELKSLLMKGEKSWLKSQHSEN